MHHLPDRANAFYAGKLYGRNVWLCIGEWYMEMRGTGAQCCMCVHVSGHIMHPGIIFQEPGLGIQGFGRCHIGFTNYTTNVPKVWTLTTSYAFWTVLQDLPSAGGIYMWRYQWEINRCKSYSSQPYSNTCPLLWANYPEESVGDQAFRRICRFNTVTLGAVRTFYGWSDYRWVKLPNGTEITVVRVALESYLRTIANVAGSQVHSSRPQQLHRPRQLPGHRQHHKL